MGRSDTTVPHPVPVRGAAAIAAIAQAQTSTTPNAADIERAARLELIENLQAILALHGSSRVAVPDLMRVEIHRELGDLDRAGAILAALQSGDLQLRRLMRQLIELRISGSWRIYLGFQNAMPRFVAH